MRFNLKVLNQDVTAFQLRENVVVTNNIFPLKIGMEENMTHMQSDFLTKKGYYQVLRPV